MRTRILFTGILTLTAALIILGCGGDDNGGGSNQIEPSFEPVEIPQGLQDAAGSDANAALAVAYVQLANSFSNYNMYFQPPSKSFAPTKPGATDDTTTWSYEGTTIEYYSWAEGDNYYWEIYVTDNIYTHCKFIDYSESKSGTNGEYRLFTDCGETPAFLWNWQFNASDIFTVTMLSESDAIQVIVNPDGSGSVTNFYGGLNSQQQHVLSWNSDGSGNYTFYDTQGGVDDSGNWDAS